MLKNVVNLQVIKGFVNSFIFLFPVLLGENGDEEEGGRLAMMFGGESGASLAIFLSFYNGSMGYVY